MKINTVKKIYAVWVYVKDLAESRKFYEDVIGLKFKLQDGDWIEFDLGQTSFGLLQRRKGDSFESQKTRVMFEVGNIEAAENILRDYGIKIIGDLRSESYGKLLTFEDINGHWLEFFEPT
ncbi:MAG: glyoxalase [Candidatus Staskawiczbacteria bacterium RIFCSPHIGHO2_02_FULL_42_22]|uniref:Glyoxalase n=1 Tax=Candidatus Staskawiczbacteria bacterium RIFCSPHIGHO2_02_FULL_42_22 TaxID=1802207 RepID=A0A1G2I4Y1_9BACT|nr:MAG: glyoxalase [Candidatus Staskawiczbacteria bacterium RIFCSPHIGHO2_02_FULL_42_22]